LRNHYTIEPCSPAQDGYWFLSICGGMPPEFTENPKDPDKRFFRIYSGMILDISRAIVSGRYFSRTGRQAGRNLAMI
jgi:hypothetical protein